jgi:hypothetical protein
MKLSKTQFLLIATLCFVSCTSNLTAQGEFVRIVSEKERNENCKFIGIITGKSISGLMGV